MFREIRRSERINEKIIEDERRRREQEGFKQIRAEHTSYDEACQFVRNLWLSSGEN